MDMEKALRMIKSARKEPMVQRRHFKDMVLERNLDVSEVQQAWETAKMVGLTYQGEDVYKIVFPFKNGKDLNIIVGVLEKGKEIRLISIFPSETTRRVKHGKK